MRKPPNCRRKLSLNTHDRPRDIDPHKLAPTKPQAEPYLFLHHKTNHSDQQWWSNFEGNTNPRTPARESFL